MASHSKKSIFQGKWRNKDLKIPIGVKTDKWKEVDAFSSKKIYISYIICPKCRQMVHAIPLNLEFKVEEKSKSKASVIIIVVLQRQILLEDPKMKYYSLLLP